MLALKLQKENWTVYRSILCLKFCDYLNFHVFRYIDNVLTVEFVNFLKMPYFRLNAASHLLTSQSVVKLAAVLCEQALTACIILSSSRIKVTLSHA